MLGREANEVDLALCTLHCEGCGKSANLRSNKDKRVWVRGLFRMGNEKGGIEADHPHP